MNFLIILFGKIFIFLSKLLNLGNGSTWPGHIALKLNSNFIKNNLSRSRIKIIVIAGTNGKTTTGTLISHVLSSTGKSVIHNASGANLINGLSSTIINNASLSLARERLAKLDQDYLIFECDENALPEIIRQTNPDYVIALNLFRDQLDRYGEIDSITKKWNESFKQLSNKSTLILNADDSQIAHLGKNVKAHVKYFGLDEPGHKELKHGADSTHCPKCGELLSFEKVFFSHLGIWKCTNCKLKRPIPDLTNFSTYPLSGTYNKYNTLATVILAKLEDVNEAIIHEAFNRFTPAFGRGEKIIYKGKSIQIFLSKNPTSFNESLETIKELNGKNLLFILNDRIPDGLDVSWIWDINLEDILTKDMNIAVTGERMFDMSLRLKYGGFFAHHNDNVQTMLNTMLNSLESDETLYILPNYSAMLDIRKLLTGKKIL